MNGLVIVAIVLCIGWAAWWWLLRVHTQRTAELERQLDELEKRAVKDD